MSQNAPINKTEVVITEAFITNARLSEVNKIDISKIITDISIHEHIGKPYLTAHIQFLDQENILQDIDFQGGEKLTITLVHSENKEEGYSITKDFLIDYTSKVIKSDERNETVIIHCIEYHVFESSVKNISRAYSGSPTQMIKKIMSEYLNKNAEIAGTDNIDNLKVIIPNLHPIEACEWLKNKAQSSFGLPYYFYSALGVDNLILKDLGTMLEQKPINLRTPYIYAPSVQSSGESVQRFYSINKFSIEKTDNLLKLIRQGLVGAEYQFIDTISNTNKKVDFRVDDDGFTKLTENNMLGGENTKFVYAPEYAVDDIKISNHNSNVISQISSSGAYQNGPLTKSYKSYNDEVTASDHKKKIVSKSMENFLAKSPISITVNGREFLSADANYSIGQIVRIVFLDNIQNDAEQRPIIDKKKSGDYIICGAKHVIKYERFDTVLLCGKLASFGEEITI
jgi:hypothetical protein